VSGPSWGSLGRAISRRTATVLAIVAVITVALGFGLRRLDFATGQDSYIDAGSQIAKDNRRYQALFGGESMVVLFTATPGRSVVDLFTPANVAQFGELEREMSASDTVHSVVSPLALLQWTQDLVTKGVASAVIARTIARDPDAASVALRQADATITALRLGQAGAPDLSNPRWVQFLLFGNDGFSLDAARHLVSPPDDQLVVRRALRAFIPDARHAIFAAVLVGNASLDQQSKGMDVVRAALAGRAFDNATVTITGTPTFLSDINDYLQRGMLTLGGLAVVVMIAILVVAFRVRWRLLPLVAMIAGTAWGFGAFGFTGTSLSLVTIAGLPILIGLGIEFAIQIQNRIEEERASHPDDPFGRTLIGLVPPLLAATVAAVLAFLTVRISKVPMVQDFGVLLSIGIVALFAAGVILPVALIGARERRSPTARAPRTGWVERTVERLGGLPRAAVLPLVAVAVVLPVLGLVLETGTKIESDPINWADPGSTSIKNARLLERETGFSSTLGIFLEASNAPSNAVFTDQMGAFVFDLVQRSLRDNPELAQASSLATTVGWLADVPNTTELPPTGLDMLQVYETAPPALQRVLVAADGNAAEVLFQVGPSSLERRARVLDRLQATIADPGSGPLLPAQASATTGGLAVVGVGLLDNITANRAQLTIAALLLVGAFVVLLSRDLVRGLLTMVPVLLAVGASATLVRTLGITLSPLTTVAGPLIVATCAEFSLLLVARYVEERRTGLDPEQSTAVAAVRTGRAFFTSALTTLGGFAVLMFSSLPLLADFGRVVTVNIAVALLSALAVVPPLVKEADRRGLLVAPTAGSGGRRRVTGWASGVAMGVAGLAVVAVSVRSEGAVAVTPRTEAQAEAPATIPTTPTTITTTTTTAAAANTTTATTTNATTATDSTATTATITTGASTSPGATASSSSAATNPAPATTLPPGPAERPTGLVAGAFYDALTGVGVEPGVARCAADDLLATTSEADLLARGIASVPRPAAVDALLAAAGRRCGVSQAQLDAAAQG
jgi:hydrophobe/amphiphile efflux-3 (HAE3) family protein